MISTKIDSNTCLFFPKIPPNHWAVCLPQGRMFYMIQIPVTFLLLENKCHFSWCCAGWVCSQLCLTRPWASSNLVERSSCSDRDPMGSFSAVKGSVPGSRFQRKYDRYRHRYIMCIYSQVTWMWCWSMLESFFLGDDLWTSPWSRATRMRL